MGAMLSEDSLAKTSVHKLLWKNAMKLWARRVVRGGKGAKSGGWALAAVKKTEE